jgi:hypothetical protein
LLHLQQARKIESVGEGDDVKRVPACWLHGVWWLFCLLTLCLSFWTSSPNQWGVLYTFAYLPVHLHQVGIIEWKVAREQNKQYDSTRPHICLGTIIAFAVDDLWFDSGYL